MIRKSICISLIVFMMSGCTGYNIRNTYVINPSSDEDLLKFHEAVDRSNRKKLHMVQKEFDVKEIFVSADSTYYSTKNQKRSNSTSFDFSAMNAVPTSDVHSLSMRVDIKVGAGIIVGVLSSAVISIFALTSSSGGLLYSDHSKNWITSRTFRCFVFGILAGAGLGLHVAKTDASWDEYTFKHDVP